jgi:hypothetical protein
MFARGELMKPCEEALASGPKSTKGIALHVMAAKGLDTGDKALAPAMSTRLIHALRRRWRQRLLSGDGKVKWARVRAFRWRREECCLSDGALNHQSLCRVAPKA